jgi:predicted transcriptional regulator
MKMMVVDDEDFELEIARSVNAAQVVQMPSKGRNGAAATPDSLRQLIAADAIEGNGSAQEIARAYGVSESSVSAYKNGATSTTNYNNGNGELKDFVDGKREKIKGRAQNKLLLALKHITDEKLKEAKVSDLSTIAANMSRVIDKTTPKTESVVNNNIVFYSPKQISKENYETVDVSPSEMLSR